MSYRIYSKILSSRNIVSQIFNSNIKEKIQNCNKKIYFYKNNKAKIPRATNSYWPNLKNSNNYKLVSKWHTMTKIKVVRHSKSQFNKFNSSRTNRLEKKGKSTQKLRNTLTIKIAILYKTFKKISGKKKKC